MDYTLAALKLFCGQLKYARRTSSQSAMTLGAILFQRAWLQGVLVSGQDERCYILDDGTDVVEFQLTNEFQQEQWKTETHFFLQVHKIVDLSPQPDREAMWHLEVIEAYKLFYQPSVVE
ncbi:unnamed protein product [Victoria cruziana]